MVSEEGLNAYGAVTWGQFFVYQGFNEKTGWMHTSSYADVIDEFLEKVTEENGNLVYQYGDEKRPVTTLQTTLKYKDGSELKAKKFAYTLKIRVGTTSALPDSMLPHWNYLLC